MKKKPSTTLPAVVEKVISFPYTKEPEKAQIAINDGDHLYREIRIENKLTDEAGNEVRLKPGAQVELTVVADTNATVPAKDNPAKDDEEDRKAAGK